MLFFNGFLVLTISLKLHINEILLINFFFREFQPIASTSTDSFLSSDQDTNQFLV